MLLVETAITEGEWTDAVDWPALADRACAAAVGRTPYAPLAEARFTAEIAVRFSDDAAVRLLNAQFRAKDRPTNVLSFPMVQPDLLAAQANADDGELLLGDIVLADGVVAAEAADKRIAVADHVTHLIVHGTLHLLGYDHADDAQAEAMEALERAIMADLALRDPYADA